MTRTTQNPNTENNAMKNTARLAQLALTVIATATLVACGGGGDAPSSSGAAPVTPAAPAVTGNTVTANGYTINVVPQPLTVGTSTYAPGSIEAGVFNDANRIRSECGFGSATSDARLDRAADSHARYMTVEGFNQTGHSEPNVANPWFSGNQPYERARAAGYVEPFQTGEGLSIYGSMDPTFIQKNPNMVNKGLMNGPYHAMDLLAPRTHLAVGAQWRSKMGLVNDQPAASLGFEWGNVVSNYGTTTTNGNPNVQDIPVTDVLTWPCNQSTDKVPTMFWSEIPNPLPNRDVNSFATAVGAPFYFASRLDANLTITSAKLFNVATGAEIPLMPVRYMRNEIYPGTTEKFTSARYMDAAFVFPDVKLPANATLRMDFTATAGGKSIAKSVTYRTDAS